MSQHAQLTTRFTSDKISVRQTVIASATVSLCIVEELSTFIW